ncbi:alpha,alpha-phosphotrehalase [Proteiniclasticum sp.]|uniref:alpha,alpha-phosphotrehalase n=1 Tax=Proteiniclasticum sp. TaxID=2053595 RepID=UPI00289B8B3C|nr:alpha,alpha-phosphotrehalase [Proteiniclasticum sp.]
MNNFDDKVIYQIYARSFMDSNGDGLGDIPGITSKLDYLKELGVDYLWLTPVFESPMNDNGYDVADYYKVDPIFGTMDDLIHLISEARTRGLGIMLDMVFNHSSISHEWFQKALKGDPKYKDYYIFRKGKDGNPPTNWVSKFGGNAWEYVSALDEYYLHLFDKTQADLNWENEEVRKELFDIVRFWLEKGVSGFRFDVVNLISKPEVYEDDHLGDGRRFYTDGHRVHEYLKELNQETFGRVENTITVGEMSSTSLENCVRYSNPEENELSMVFNFHHLKVDYEEGDKWSLKPFDFQELKEIFDHWQMGMQQHNGNMALFFNNHDQPRVVSRFGNDQKYRKESAKMLATSIHMLRGIPYIFQGEEFGMPNAYFDSIEDYRDVESINYYHILKELGMQKDQILSILQEKSRDNGRTPVMWNEEEGHGFTRSVPWIPFCKMKGISAEGDLIDDDSIFRYYQKLIRLRKKNKAIQKGSYKIIDKNHKALFAYLRSFEDEKVLVICNYYDQEVLFDPARYELPELSSKRYTVLLSNYNELTEQEGKILIKPYESLVINIERQ